MPTLLENFEKTYKKPQLSDVRSGDSVRVHQRIIEGSKERVQVFEGVVIRTHRKNSLSASITVRRVASGIGVEKTFLVHAPNIEKIEVTRGSKVRRNYLSYLRERSGKSARLREVGLNRAVVDTDSTAKAENETPAGDESSDQDTAE